MFRITDLSTPDELRWKLCGRLAGPWVAEFKASWLRASGTHREHRRLIDLTDVSFVDEAGEGALRELQAQGVEFVACGVENQHMLKNLTAKGKRSLRKLVSHLDSPCKK